MQAYPEYQIGYYFCSEPKAATSKMFITFSFDKCLSGNKGLLDTSSDMCKRLRNTRELSTMDGYSITSDR